ncbi:pyrimidine-nucleoside phosphorylase [Clostridiaceae bacterium 68-1-5]|uniref:Pyrimidine-nucleoside phosphorylase n=2 Tax=Suipraeoptans intestinalis TaxID=2606628 RepID=A0A6N7URI0_9FIRM|nr:pyrimidine-nucleoside phosphorylase [Suipraeoptans intestinalis]MDY3121726.1 pyrimidine-nucleoside phosphorylase [Suipraeoptans intestinalis]MSR93323.1 pyrimidine-nucleoside phosphorylase [Suipraeoptans intestinalis]
MRMYDVIMKKRNGGVLTEEEIREVISGYVAGEIPDYQMSAFLMAVYFQGMTEEETVAMTEAVAHSGDMVDLSAIAGIKVDKHSTGGVGDKTSLIIGPIVAACGVKVAKMSGRGLGHTGGTVDKMEAIPGMRTDLSREEFFRVVNQTGLSIIGQTGNLAPADKKLYALRDVTATVDSIPLIAVSIMSKKLAAGSDAILLDVKTGSGAFMKTLEDSIALAKEMVSIGENAGRKTAALITDMDIPLGNNIGNSLEVMEAVETLKGNGPADLTEVCIHLAGNMLYLAGKGTIEECMALAKAKIEDGSALERLAAMVEAQGGDASVILDPSRFAKAPYSMQVFAEKEGYIGAMDTEGCGIASSMLGAGRQTKDSAIDPAAGIVLKRKVGDYVTKEDVIAVLYTSDSSLLEQAQKKYVSSVRIQVEAPKKEPLIYARVTKEAVERF